MTCRFLAAAIVLALTSPALLPAKAAAQDQVSYPDEQRPGPLLRQELESILAPIALYPDEVLSDVLMAATYPLDVIDAARWVERPENAILQGERLSDALLNKNWDLSVKALTPFPQILKMMNTDIEWLGKLGQGFVFQEGDVMNAVQRLRRDAMVNGTLVSDYRQRVFERDGSIIIEPANPAMVYIPVYEPVKVYTRWTYPDYPPVYIPPPQPYVYVPGPYYSYYYSYTVPALWGWHSWDWGLRRIVIIDRHKYHRHNHWHRHNDHSHWRHDPRHRGGIGFGHGYGNWSNNRGGGRGNDGDGRGPYNPNDGLNPRVLTPGDQVNGNVGSNPGVRNPHGVITPPRPNGPDYMRPPVPATPSEPAAPVVQPTPDPVIEVRKDDPPAAFDRRPRPTGPDYRRPPRPDDPNSQESQARLQRRFQQDTSITAPPVTSVPRMREPSAPAMPSTQPAALPPNYVQPRQPAPVAPPPSSSEGSQQVYNRGSRSDAVTPPLGSSSRGPDCSARNCFDPK